MNGVLKIILTSISLFVAACGMLVARRVFIPKPVMLDSIAASVPNEEPPLKERINNSVNEDVTPGYVPRPHWEWIGDAERAQLESVWADAATNLLNRNVQGMKECVATVSERMKSVSPEQFYGIVRPFYDMLKSDRRVWRRCGYFFLWPIDIHTRRYV